MAPWVGFWLLLPLALLGGLFTIPVTSIGRQIMISAVEDRQRTAALSLTSLTIELGFIVGPVLGVLSATHFDTRWVLFSAQMISVLGGVLICARNPRLMRIDAQTDQDALPSRWMNTSTLTVLTTTTVVAIVLFGTELVVIAAFRTMGHPNSAGWALAIWGLGSMLGALIYGLLKPVSPSLLLLVVAGTTLLVAIAPGPIWLTILLFAAGLSCAPTMTATVYRLSQGTPARFRGRALGWHTSAINSGAAIGGPIAGLAVDQANWRVAFVVLAFVGMAVALGGIVLDAGRRDESTND